MFRLKTEHVQSETIKKLCSRWSEEKLSTRKARPGYLPNEESKTFGPLCWWVQDDTAIKYRQWCRRYCYMSKRKIIFLDYFRNRTMVKWNKIHFGKHKQGSMETKSRCGARFLVTFIYDFLDMWWYISLRRNVKLSISLWSLRLWWSTNQMRKSNASDW